MSIQGNTGDHIPKVYALVQQGKLQEAEEICHKLVEKFPREADSWSWLGYVNLVQKRYVGAEAALKKAVELDPRDAASWDNLGHAVSGLGRFSEAEAHSRRALKIDPQVANYWTSLGAALTDQLRWSDAREALTHGLTLNPQDPSAWANLGNAESNLGRLSAAEIAYHRALAIAPDHPDVVIKYAFLLCNRNQPDRGMQMVQALSSRVALSPSQLADAWLLLAYGYKLLDKLEWAEQACRRALAAMPGRPDCLLELAHILRLKSLLPEAEACVRQILVMVPDHADSWALLGLLLHAQYKTTEAISALRRSTELKPNPHHYSKLLATMQYGQQVSPSELLAAHQQWDATFGKPFLSSKPTEIARIAAGKPLRLGFVSMDFGFHPTGQMVLPALENLDKRQCSIFCYSDRMVEDEYTARFRRSAEGWRTVSGLTDEELTEQIRSDHIDILFDLTGHFGERLGVFARRSAPQQITWFGYVGTTGLSAMDFIIADRFHIPDLDECWYVEKVLRMPHDYACFAPPPEAPAVGPLPALDSKQVTFACFNNSTKYTPALFDAWATILRRVPNSQLFIKFLWLGHPDVQKGLREEFAKRDIDPARILIEGRSPHLEMLGSYNRVDIALDTQPYSGGVTTCEALWMGVPVITFPGQTFAGRHSTSHLTNAGYPQFIAKDLDGYIDLAVSWANRLDELAALRAQMRDRLRASPLCDAPRFAQDFLHVLQHAWISRQHT